VGSLLTLVSLQELPQRSDLDEELRPYFDTALRADDSNFWLKLR
jgi:hypothetical protein